MRIFSRFEKSNASFTLFDYYLFLLVLLSLSTCQKTPENNSVNQPQNSAIYKELEDRMYEDSIAFLSKGKSFIHQTEHTSNYLWAIKTHILFANYHGEKKQKDDYLNSLNNALNLAKKHHNLEWINYCKIDSCRLLDVSNDYRIRRVETLLAEATKNQYKKSQIKAHLLLARSYTGKHLNINRAIQHAFSILKFADKIKDSKDYIDGLCALVQIELIIELWESGLSHSKEALQLCKNNHFKEKELLVTASLIPCLFHLKKYDEALAYLEKATKLNDKIQYKFLDQYLISNYAIIQYELKKYPESVHYLNRLPLDSIHPFYKARFLQVRGLCALAMKDKVEANKCASIFENEIESFDPIGKITSLDYLYQWSASIKQYKNAFFYLEEYNKMVAEIGTYKINDEIIRSYDENRKTLEKKRQLITQLNTNAVLNAKQLDVVKWRNSLYIIVIVSLVIFITGIFYTYKKYKLQQRLFTGFLIQSIDNERTRIARDLHDDIVQLLAMIKNKIHILKRTKPSEFNENIEQDIDEIISNTREISHSLHPILLTKIGLAKALKQLFNKVSDHSDIDCHFEVNDDLNILSIGTQKEVYNVVKECLSNTLRHADAHKINLSIDILKNKMLLSYSDNGKGMEAATKENKFSLQTIQERCKILSAQWQFGNQANGGFSILIQIPIQ